MLLFANCWTRLQGASTDPFAPSDFQKKRTLKAVQLHTDPLTHQLICLHQHLDFYWMTGNTCDSSQDCKVDRQSQTEPSKDRRHVKYTQLTGSVIETTLSKILSKLNKFSRLQSWQEPNRALERYEALAQIWNESHHYSTFIYKIQLLDSFAWLTLDLCIFSKCHLPEQWRTIREV